MATLNSSNIVNGNTIQPNDLLQLYDAFTAGGGTTGAYNVSISGSLTGSATTATNASKLDPTLNASTNQNYNVLFATTSSATYETIYKENGDIMTYNPSTNVLTVTSSYATTASYAISASYAPQTFPTYTNISVDSSTYPPGTEFLIDSSCANIIFVKNGGGGNQIGFAFNVGTEGQLVKFTTEKSQTGIDLANFCITASVGVNGLGGISIPPTPPTNEDTLSNLVSTPGGILWSFDFYYTGGEWNLITPFAN